MIRDQQTDDPANRDVPEASIMLESKRCRPPFDRSQLVPALPLRLDHTDHTHLDARFITRLDDGRIEAIGPEPRIPRGSIPGKEPAPPGWGEGWAHHANRIGSAQIPPPTRVLPLDHRVGGSGRRFRRAGAQNGSPSQADECREEARWMSDAIAGPKTRAAAIASIRRPDHQPDASFSHAGWQDTRLLAWGTAADMLRVPDGSLTAAPVPSPSPNAGPDERREKGRSP